MNATKIGLGLIFLSIIVLAPTCVNDPPQTQKVSKLNIGELTTDNACKTLLVVMEDRSGSMEIHRKLTIDDYKQILQQFIQNHSGVVAVRVIGNVPPADRDFFRFEVLPPYDEKAIPEDATLSEKAAINNLNKRIKVLNDSLKQDAIAKVDQWLEVVADKVIAYKPANKDITNVVEALEHLNSLLHEPHFSTYDKIVVVLFSDGIHDADKRSLQGVLKVNRPVDMMLMGWEDESIFAGIGQIMRFESKEGFLSAWRNYRCKK